MSRPGRGPAPAPGDPGGRTRGPRAAAAPLAAALLAGAVLLAPEGPAGPAEPAAQRPVAGEADGPGGSAPGGRRDGGAHLDGPPPGHTGGFDEPTCRACHFDRPLNPEGGDVRLEGLPERWAADSVYEMRVVLAHGDLRRAGFQLSLRWRSGRRAGCSAGELRPAGSRTQAVAASDTSAGGAGACEVVYVQHSERGAGPVEEGVARWRIRWRAPPAAGEAGGPVVVHVAANAANDDASEFGDRIYAAEAVVRPAQ